MSRRCNILHEIFAALTHGRTLELLKDRNCQESKHFRKTISSNCGGQMGPVTGAVVGSVKIRSLNGLHVPLEVYAGICSMTKQRTPPNRKAVRKTAMDRYPAGLYRGSRDRDAARDVEVPFPPGHKLLILQHLNR